MKSVGIITDRKSSLWEFIEKNIMEIFAGFIEIKRYFLDEMSDEDIINDDVLLIMSNERFIESCKYIDDTNKAIVINRTVREKDIFQVFEIPENTEVLLVNDTKETTLDTASMLYKIGIRNLNIIQYEEGKLYPDIKVAITPGVSRKVPKTIEKIVDIGNRYIDVSTFLEMSELLGFDNNIIKERMIAYSNSIITLDRGIRGSIKEILDKTVELELISNLSNEGSLLINSEYEILRYNDTFAEMFNIDKNLMGISLDFILSDENLKLIKGKKINQELMKHHSKKFLVSKKPVTYFNEITRFYINFQEITYIKKLEKALSNKIKNRGLIARYNFSDIVAKSETMKKCIALTQKLAVSDDTVLITGESGTGKELLAQSIHNASDRHKFPFVAVNCAAISETLLESELFGYEGGSFTGALKQGKPGYFELAHHGTIFLDEIGDMPISLQTRLLRVLQEKQVMRIGSSEVLSINVRVIAATNKNLRKMIELGKFREDLYYRINVLPIEVPPLRKRKEDILPLIDFFMKKDRREMTDEVRSVLLDYDWPGNIRELENAASYFKIVNTSILSIEDMPNYLSTKDDDFALMHADIAELDRKNCVYEILRLVFEFTEKNTGIGRQRIESELKILGVDITESETRRLILELNKFGLLVSGKGRAGTLISKKGIAFYKWLRSH